MTYAPTFFRRFTLGLALLATAGCATVDPRGDYGRTDEKVAAATGQDLGYRPDDEARARAQVAQLLRDGLTVDEAVQVCLLNNRKIQAALCEVGAARADVVQAGLLSNPTLSFGLRFPDGGGLANFEAALVQNLADLWQIPARQRAAERALDHTILRVAREASVAVFDAKTAYYRARQADRKREIATESAQIAQQVLDLALTRQQAGAGSEVDVNLARSEVLDAELALRAAALEAVEARAALAVLLSLPVPPSASELTDPLPEPPGWQAEATALLALATEHRLDLQAAEMAAQAAWAQVREEQLKLFPSLELGVSMSRDEERTPEGRNILADSVRSSISEREPRLELGDKEDTPIDTVIGPTIGMELPLFNQNQGGIARAQFTYDASRKLQDDLTIQVTQEVYLASARARTVWDNVAFYRDQVLPLRETSLDLARSAYQAGRTPLLNVLEAERALLNARAGYAESLQASASAVVEIEKATGQPVKSIVAASQAAPANAPHEEASQPAASDPGNQNRN